MNLSDKAEAALEEALLNQNSTPLNTLIGFIVRIKGSADAQVLNEIRSDVYLGLTKLVNKAQTIQEMASQLYIIVVRARASYYRRTLRHPHEASFEDESVKAKDSLSAPANNTLSPDQEAKCDAVMEILTAMGSSGKSADRKRYLALMAEISGGDPVEAVRSEFGPDITPNYASQLKHRGIEQVKAAYEASKGKKTS
jgi:hypothetical protein